MKIYNKGSTKIKRRNLKRNMTEEERILWEVMRYDALGVRFRRQYGVGEYIVDFYSPKLKLAIEIDGKQHYSKDALEYDRIREEYMNKFEIITIRFSNKEIRENIKKVVAKIKEYIKS